MNIRQEHSPVDIDMHHHIIVALPADVDVPVVQHGVNTSSGFRTKCHKLHPEKVGLDIDFDDAGDYVADELWGRNRRMVALFP